MKKQGPMYIREENGELTPLNIPITNDVPDCIGNESSIGELVVAGHPEWEISRKDYEIQCADIIRKRYNERVGPAVTVSLENNGTVSVEGFSRNANVSLTEAKKWLERLYKAGLVDKKEGEYVMDAEKIRSAQKAFGLY